MLMNCATCQHVETKVERTYPSERTYDAYYCRRFPPQVIQAGIVHADVRSVFPSVTAIA